MFGTYVIVLYSILNFNVSNLYKLSDWEPFWRNICPQFSVEKTLPLGHKIVKQVVKHKIDCKYCAQILKQVQDDPRN
ncbi:MAG: hypothetical protein K0Q95_1201 [Bacteroidota bacterium]|jgi:hypothetical protein|nr:hypothetical protein [Bacteroidota bacterium]